MSAPHRDHDRPDLPAPSVEQVAEDVYAYVQLDGSWGLNNSGFLVGNDAVTVIDSCFTERRTRGLIDTVASVTPRPLRTLINTHHHGDHTQGNYLLPSATDEQVAYLRFVQEVASRGYESGEPPLDLALETDLGPFASLHDPERIVGNLYRVYSELRGEAPGRPIDPQAYADMVTYNSGQPLSCWA